MSQEHITPLNWGKLLEGKTFKELMEEMNKEPEKTLSDLVPKTINILKEGEGKQ
ncbi:MAG: hypothetical protein AABY22_10940 [Nanoarchaeota archaeon]